MHCPCTCFEYRLVADTDHYMCVLVLADTIIQTHDHTLIDLVSEFGDRGSVPGESVYTDNIKALLFNVLHEPDQEPWDIAPLSLTQRLQLTSKHWVCGLN